ncbi:putative NBD/HSP70 family sugar kinase [Agrococcus sp. UYP10]|uniref:hypothetical protein n=1 Tax=Agrococcus sp. UYP10 TaxID=1756355 RepID=UPI003397FF99
MQSLRAPANAASVLRAALARGTATRADLIEDTGLSKATVARMVDELHRNGLLVHAAPPAPALAAQRDPARTRGRKPTSLTVPASVGQVVGVSLGLQRTGVLALDLAGRERSWESAATPRWSTLDDAVAWVAERIVAAGARTDAPLLRVAIALPARVADGTEVPNPPPPLDVLAGAAFAQQLAAALDAPVALDSDANMALVGLVADGAVADAANPTLLSMSTVLTVAVRRSDGTAAPGRTSSFGSFSLLPFQSDGIDTSLGAMLSTQGLLRYCAERGVALTDVSELWGGDAWDAPSSGEQQHARRVAVVRRSTDAAPDSAAPHEHGTIRAAFADALTAALRVVAVMVDPPLVVLTGRLSPLAELVLPAVARRLAAELDEPPELVVASAASRWHATAMGAAHVALRHEQRALCERLERGSAQGD